MRDVAELAVLVSMTLAFLAFAMVMTMIAARVGSGVMRTVKEELVEKPREKNATQTIAEERARVGEVKI